MIYFLIGYYLVHIFNFQKLSVMLVAALTNSGVKNQVPQFLFKTAAGDLVLVSSYEVGDI